MGWTPAENPLEGFTWVRRRMPTCTVALGQGNAAAKTMKAVHAATFECGESGLWQFRLSVKNFLADQSTESCIPRTPIGGYDINVREVLDRIVSGAMQLEDPHARNMYFLMRAMDRPEHLHIFFNALEESVTGIPEYKDFDSKFRSIIKCTGSRQWKQTLFETAFSEAPSHVRAALHQAVIHVVDWRREYFEDALQQQLLITPWLLDNFSTEDFDMREVMTQNILVVGIGSLVVVGSWVWSW